MQDNDVNYCQFEDIRATIVTFNAGAALPPSLRHDEQSASFLTNLCRDSDTPDILVFGFQELVDLEDKKTTASTFRPWSGCELLILHQRAFLNPNERNKQVMIIWVINTETGWIILYEASMRYPPEKAATICSILPTSSVSSHAFSSSRGTKTGSQIFMAQK